jgi:hypothetical protein
MILRPDMKNRSISPQKKRKSETHNGVEVDKYWWTCYAGAQNDGKGCGLWRVLNMESEKRGPVVGNPTV